VKKNLFYILIIIFLFIIVCTLTGILVSIHRDTTFTTTPKINLLENTIIKKEDATIETETNVHPSVNTETPLIIEEKQQEETPLKYEEEPKPKEYEKFLIHGIKPREAKYYEHE